MSFLILILKIVGSLSLFIYGMKVMSDGIQRAAGSQLRSFLKSITKNRFVGLVTGIFTTAAVQSSSATTVMTVSLVNAGLINLKQSAGVMIGANIGTTVTAWIIAGLGFQLDMEQIVLPLLAIGVPLLLSKSRYRYYGEFIVGFSIIFLGLNYLTSSIPDISSNQQLLEWFKKYTDTGIGSRILFVFIGALITIIIQSSSAAMALTLTVCVKGWLPYELGAAMILGENIGTTITAELAAVVGNTQAKRSARIHSLFNLLGIFWMIFLIPNFLDLISKGLSSFGYQSAYSDPASAPIALAAFHSIFNVLNAILMIGIVPFLVRLAIITVPNSKSLEDVNLKFITNSTLSPELAIAEVKKESQHFMEVVSRMSTFSRNHVNSVDNTQRKNLSSRITKYEAITDTMESEITTYLNQLSSREITSDTARQLSSYYTICNDLERIGDIFMQIALDIDRKNKSKIWFAPEQRNALNKFYDLIDKAFKITIGNIEFASENKEEIIQVEEEMNLFYEELKNEYLENIDMTEVNLRGSLIFYNTITLLENIGNHIFNINNSTQSKE